MKSRIYKRNLERQFRPFYDNNSYTIKTFQEFLYYNIKFVTKTAILFKAGL